MTLFDQVLKAGRAAADAALSQPGVRRRVEAAQARYDELRREAEERVQGWESTLWAWVQNLEQEVRRHDRQRDRVRRAEDHYAVLGIDPGATLDEVKAAYRRLMRKHHPDRYAHDPAAEARAHVLAQRINHAYAELVALLTGRENRRSR